MWLLHPICFHQQGYHVILRTDAVIYTEAKRPDSFSMFEDVRECVCLKETFISGEIAWVFPWVWVFPRQLNTFFCFQKWALFFLRNTVVCARTHTHTNSVLSIFKKASSYISRRYCKGPFLPWGMKSRRAQKYDMDSWLIPISNTPPLASSYTGS